MSQSLSGYFYRWQWYTMLSSFLLISVNVRFSLIYKIKEIPSYIQVLLSSPVSICAIILSLATLSFWLLFLIEWSRLDDELKKSPVRFYFIMTSSIAWVAITYYVFLEVFGFKEIPLSEWNWYGIILLILSGIITAVFSSTVLSALLLTRTKKESKTYELPRIPQIAKRTLYSNTPIVVVLIFGIFTYGVYSDFPINNSWFYLAGIPFIIINTFILYSNFKKNSHDLSIYNEMVSFSNYTDHMIRVQKNIDAFPQGKDARERARLSSKQKDARVEPVEEICITMGKTEQLQIKPKVKNKDTITSMMSLVSNPSQNKTIEIPCKFLTGDLKTFNQKLQEGPAAFFNYLEKAFRLALWEMSYEKNNHVVNMDEFNNVIFGGDFDAVQFFINKQVDINVAAKGGWTPVMSAAAQGQIKILVYLLNHGGNPNFQNLMKATALMHVAKHDDLDSAKVLVSFGADLNLQDFEGNTALMKAISDRSAKVALFLINHGADTSIKNKKGEDALRLAEKNYMGEIAKILRLNNSSTKSAPLQAQNQSFSKQQRKKKKKK